MIHAHPVAVHLSWFAAGILIGGMLGGWAADTDDAFPKAMLFLAGIVLTSALSVVIWS
jgi:hypothetical protein